MALKTALLVAALCGIAVAQIPSLGWCPDYVPMADFNMERVSTHARPLRRAKSRKEALNCNKGSRNSISGQPCS